MKGLAITSKGIEDITAIEIKELIKAKTQVKDSCVIFDIKDYSDLCTLCYKSQSVNKILFLIDSFKIKDYDDLNIDKITKEHFFGKETFRVSSKVIESKLSSQEVNKTIGEKIFEKFSKKVDLNDPDITFFVYIFKDQCYIGIDFAGFSLHKRSYKIFLNRNSIRGTIAYALLRLAEFKPKETLLDPFMGAGTIPIEAALYASKLPVNYFNKEKFAFSKYIDFNFKEEKGLNKTNIIGYDLSWISVNNSKKNAKIAGINKLVSFSRLEAEWLDTKFKEETVDKIVTQPPDISKHTNPKEIEKVYEEFFHQAEFILKKEGLIVLISRKKDKLNEISLKHKFKIKEEREVSSGKDVLNVLVFCKK
jgi:23S rRNA G2445 N2-methylase RlmL